MNEQDFDILVAYFVQVLRDLAPKRTGNLAYNAIRVERVSGGAYKIYVQTEGEHKAGALDGIAPYQKYLNENPKSRHYQWWQAAIERAIEELATKAGGKVL